MNWFAAIYRSAVGKKAAMAISGIVLFGFVVNHMVGNLKAFLGPGELNDYAAWLRTVGYPGVPHGGILWAVRGVLLLALAVHFGSAMALWREARRARPVAYGRRQAVQVDFAARTMRWGGLILLAYAVYHLLHLTWGWSRLHPAFRHPETVDGQLRFFAYENLVAGFQSPLVAGVYIVASLMLGLHLYHGLWSLFQTLGWNHPRYNAWRRGFAVTFAVAVAAGFVSVPVAVLAGVIR